MKKTLWLALILLLVYVFAFSACDSGDASQTPNDTPSGTTDNTTESETDDHVHSFGEWTTVKDATCTVKGEQERSCSCGEKETQSIDALGHTEVIDAAVAATCTTDGKTEGKHCSVCNETLIAQEVIAKLAHAPATDAAVEATCSATGLTDGSHCSVCNAVITAQQVVAKKAHTTSEWLTDTEATCSVAGAKHKECTVCHTVLESGSIDKIAHTPATDAAVEATCSVTGLTEGSHCSVCNAVITAQQVVAKKDHTIVVDAAVDATCNSTGLTEGNHCSVCNATLVAQRVTSKLTHVLSVKMTDIPETCSDNGTYYIECTLCHIILERGILEGGHDYEATVVPPTASAQGYTQHVCSRCNDTYTDTVVPALGFTGLAYIINEDGRTCTITGLGSVTETEIAIPLEIDGYKVTAIGDKAFENCTHLTKILLQDSITTIGTRAFYGCTGLTEFTIPKNVYNFGTQIFYKATNLKIIYYNSSSGAGTDNPILAIPSIEKVVFGGTSLPQSACYNVTNIKEVQILDSIGTIPESAFQGCSNLVKVSIGNNVYLIEDYAFEGCSNLEEIVLGESIRYLGDWHGDTFTGCSKLKKVYFMGTLEDWCKIKYAEYPDGCQPCQYGADLYINGELLINVTIPNTITVIQDYAFYNCQNIETIIIPDTITKIGKSAFYNCKLVTTLLIPDSVTNIGSSAFSGCDNLTNVVISDSVSSIGSSAFGYDLFGVIYCAAESQPNGWSSYWYESSSTPIVWDCNNNDVATDGYIHIIIDSIHYGIKDGVATIVKAAKEIETVSIPETINYKDVDYEVTIIASQAFYNCTNLASVTIPDTITSIGSYAFYNCSNLSIIIIPNSVVNIDYYAFSGCSNLTIACNAESLPSEWNSNWNSSNRPVVWGCTGEEYTYTFNVNGGDIVESIKSVVAIELPTPTKEGYYFGGWYDNAEFNGTPLASPYYSSSTHTLYAKWLTEEEWLDGTTFERAIVIVCDEMQNVVIDTAGERVYFKFVATETRAYTISSQGGLDTYGHLYNSSTSQIASNNGGNDFSITYTLTAGETYYIAARMYSSSATGTFTITIS